VLFYRQSDIPEIPELTWLLTCVTAKGLLNRAHAYKAAVDANVAAGEDPDAGVTAGLYMYPVLMAADILMFNAHVVPVGRDQVQHIEIARDLAQRFNHLYGRDYFTLPEAQIDQSTAVLPGLDGRKMSKSYKNTIPLWAPRDNLRKAILGIVTNSQQPGEPKDPDSSHIFTIYRAFASADESDGLRKAFLDGISWGAAKEALFERIDSEITPSRDRYMKLLADPEHIEGVLGLGGEKARAVSSEFVRKLRNAVGIRPLSGTALAFDAFHRARQAGDYSNWAPAEFSNPYKWHDGFRFRVTYANGEMHLLGESDTEHGFPSPKIAGSMIKRIRETPPDDLDVRVDEIGESFELSIYVDGGRVARGSGFSEREVAAQALAQLRGALVAAFEVFTSKAR